MRVLHVSASMSPQWGGPVTVLAGLVPALSRHGVRCEIATTCGYRVGTDPLQIPGAPLHCFDTALPARVWTAWTRNLPGFLASRINRFDLVHVHELWHHAGYAACRAALAAGLPCVVTPHGALDLPRLKGKSIRKWLYLCTVQRPILRSVDAIHALVSSEKEDLSRLGIDTPVFLAPNGTVLSPPAELADTAKFLERYPRLAGRRVVLFLGRLHAIKGLDVLARSFAATAARFPDAALLVVGPDEDGTGRRAKAVLARAGVLDRVVFTGHLAGAGKQAAFACADLFVLPSYSEGFSMAALEALAAGLPVVLSEPCNFPEVAECGAGFVVPTADAAVTAAVGALLSDEHLRARMGRNGRALVEERYTWPTIAESFARLYRTLAQEEQG